MHVIIRGMTVEYVRKGNSGTPKLLVIHGWGDNSVGWAPMVERLSQEYDVVVPDLPGFGATQSPEGAWDLNDYGQFISDFARKLKFKPAVIIGHSNGGAIAIRGLANGVLSAGSLVLLDSSGLRSEFKGRSKILRILTKTGKYLSYPLPHAIKKRLRHKVYKTIGSDMLVKEELQETFKRIVTDDIQASAAKLSLPTLIIYGEDDEATPVTYGRILHSLIDNSTLETVSAAGHFVHLDKPDTVATLIGDFIA